jgi:NADPH-dependent glutamate synthase beta subunit-like oxidoreductase/Pyruvate/2-oxoacid:ferredoxin oxidoreductase delta subunit
MMLYANRNNYFPEPTSVETVSTRVNKTGLWRFLTPLRKEKVSPCRSLCPLESGIPRWMNKVKEGNWGEAWQIMSEYNPFPTLTGYACYQFCREKCSRALYDEPIAIGEVEKEIGLWRQKNYDPKKSVPEKGTGKKVVIVGSGPAGLSSAFYLNMLGVSVTILEKLPVAGGLLATGIPEYRLPRDILKKELEILEAEGIVIKTGYEVGESDLPNLLDNFDAVLLAVGAQESKPLHLKGEDLPGVTGGVEFLRDLHLGKLKEVQGRVIVIGGGNAAVDAACAAKQNGAEEVTLLYRRCAEEMPAHADEIKAAGEAGVDFIFQTVVEEIIGEGKVQKVRAVKTALSCRGEDLTVLGGTDFYLDCNLIIAAAGQESKLSELAPSFSGEPLIFSAGDAVTGPSTVAGAIFSGREAALDLFSLLEQGKERNEGIRIASSLTGKEETVGFESLNSALYSRQKRLDLPEEEAGRCFSCGLCSKCGVCWIFCPDLSVDGLSGDYEFLLDYCKGCGICVTECPTGVLTMEEVVSDGA